MSRRDVRLVSLVDVTNAAYTAKFRYDCTKALICHVSGGTEDCHPAFGGGGDMLYPNRTDSVIDVP